jgi:hypothetical protein
LEVLESFLFHFKQVLLSDSELVFKYVIDHEHPGLVIQVFIRKVIRVLLLDEQAEKRRVLMRPIYCKVLAIKRQTFRLLRLAALL